MDITPIITMFLQLVITIFTLVGTFVIKQYVIPWVKTKLTGSQLEVLKSFITQMIKAAEQLEANGTFSEFEEKGKAKKDYVLSQVKAYCEKYGITFDEKIVSDLIESLIQDVKN